MGNLNVNKIVNDTVLFKEKMRAADFYLDKLNREGKKESYYELLVASVNKVMNIAKMYSCYKVKLFISNNNELVERIKKSKFANEPELSGLTLIQ